MLASLAILIGPVGVAEAQFTYTSNGNAITITGFIGDATELVVPDTIDGQPVARIGEYAFSFYTNLNSISIPDSVTSIGIFAFQHCVNLKSVSIGSGVNDMPDSAFYLCNRLTTITIDESNASYSSLDGVWFNKYHTILLGFPAGRSGGYAVPGSVNIIGRVAFYSCSGLTSIAIGNSVNTILDNAFYGCTGLTNVILPDSVTALGTRAFESCSGLVDVTIGSGVTNIQENTFSSCTSLANVSLGNHLSVLGNSAFYNCTGLTNFVIGESVTSIGEMTFDMCTALTNVSIGQSVSTIGAGAFGYCSSLKSITIPNGVTNIERATFESCTDLTSVTIPEGVTGVGDIAFLTCSSLKTISIPDSVTSIGYSAFAFCNSMEAFIVAESNPNFSSPNGVLFNKDITQLIQYPAGRAGNYAIPKTVTNIDQYAFASSLGLTNIVILESVIGIDSYAFEGCADLASVYFAGAPPSLGWGVFWGVNDATIYYSSEASRWGPTFGGLPTVLWDPQIKVDDPSFGVQADQFGFTITGAADLTIVVEASDDLTQPNWQPVSTNTLSGGLSHFSDPNWATHRGHFYRLRSP